MHSRTVWPTIIKVSFAKVSPTSASVLIEISHSLKFDYIMNLDGSVGKLIIMLILFFGAAFLAEVVGSVAGFGSSTIFLPLALLFVDFKTALVLVAVFHFFGNIGRMGFFRQGLDRKILVRFGVPSVFFTLVGAQLVSIVSQDLLKSVLGIFLIGYSLMANYSPSISFNFCSISFSSIFSFSIEVLWVSDS